ncbi:MAG TPA: FHIPEP family type III secretion protein, partial [Spirochaetota bacterium]|nr:FHIPEP family type III secretion protein [Spirochaetota bacterium]
MANGKITLLERIFQNSTMLLVMAVLMVLIMIIVPLPVVFLDFLMIVNMLLSLIIIITVISSKRALDFSIFPTILLFTTVFRLAVNVSSTRLILTQGSSFSGQVIRAFADFVVSGNYVVGIIVFIIIMVIQFMVITKGATRVSEVSARFKLDAIPGKQMAIDADLNAGLIDEQEALRRRQEINQEADFYGSMDGASKFVSGDVIASII